MDVKNEWTDAGRDGRTRLARNKFSAVITNEDGEKFIFRVQLTASRISNETRVDPYSAERADHAYLHVDTSI